MRTRWIAALAGGLALLPGIAQASETHVDGGTVVVNAAPGELNDIQVRPNSFEGDVNRYYVSDSGATLTYGAGCTAVVDIFGDHYCEAGGAALNVVVNLGDQSDRATLATPGSVFGGDGDDKLYGGSAGPQVFDGGPGNDSMNGDESESSYCNVGPAGVGQDTFVGGPGTDTVSYHSHNVPNLSVTLDGVANDGYGSENDNVGPDVENVTGTACGGNTLVGTDGPNALAGPGVLRGGGGDDVLTGSYGDDTLDGGPGNDKLHGLNGNDKLDGGDGNDFLEGGFDDDIVTGGAGVDSFAGDETASNTIGTGNDTINAQDGVAENVSCGPGADTANVDTTDTLAIDTQNLCEIVHKTAAPSGGGSGAGSLVAFSKPTLRSGTKLRLPFVCRITNPAGCNGKVTVTAAPKGKRKVVLGTKTVSVGPKGRQTLSYTLSKKGRAVVRANRKLPLVVTTKLRTTSGTKTVTVRLLLKR